MQYIICQICVKGKIFNPSSWPGHFSFPARSSLGVQYGQNRYQKPQSHKLLFTTPLWRRRGAAGLWPRAKARQTSDRGDGRPLFPGACVSIAQASGILAPGRPAHEHLRRGGVGIPALQSTRDSTLTYYASCGRVST